MLNKGIAPTIREDHQGTEEGMSGEEERENCPRRTVTVFDRISLVQPRIRVLYFLIRTHYWPVLASTSRPSAQLQCAGRSNEMCIKFHFVGVVMSHASKFMYVRRFPSRPEAQISIHGYHKVR